MFDVYFSGCGIIRLLDSERLRFKPGHVGNGRLFIGWVRQPPSGEIHFHGVWLVHGRLERPSDVLLRWCDPTSKSCCKWCVGDVAKDQGMRIVVTENLKDLDLY